MNTHAKRAAPTALELDPEGVSPISKDELDAIAAGLFEDAQELAADIKASFKADEAAAGALGPSRVETVLHTHLQHMREHADHFETRIIETRCELISLMGKREALNAAYEKAKAHFEAEGERLTHQIDDADAAISTLQGFLFAKRREILDVEQANL